MLVFHVGRSLAFVDEPTAWAFDGQAGIDAFGQFLVALGAAYFFHCKPVSGNEIGDRLDLLSRGWRVFARLAGLVCLFGAGSGVRALDSVARLYLLWPPLTQR